jgi:hypothetical protein
MLLSDQQLAHELDAFEASAQLIVHDRLSVVVGTAMETRPAGSRKPAGGAQPSNGEVKAAELCPDAADLVDQLGEGAAP